MRSESGESKMGVFKHLRSSLEPFERIPSLESSSDYNYNNCAREDIRYNYKAKDLFRLGVTSIVDIMPALLKG